MDTKIRNRFLELWGKYFPGAELPIAFYYSDEAGGAELVAAPQGHQCFIAQLTEVRSGRSRCFNADSIVCGGGKRYLGFAQELAPDFEYFLSCGIPDKLEGERYKKSPELVRELMKKAPHVPAPAPYIVFKRWDKLGPNDAPEVVIFFAPADVLSGLFTLANFEESAIDGVFTPFCAGCGSIVHYPYLEKGRKRPRAVLGMFDVSARPCVQEDVLTFAVPMGKFARMVDDVEESFLITSSWGKVRARIAREHPSSEIG